MDTDEAPPYLAAYDNFFKALYNLDPTFSIHDHESLIGETILLLSIAEELSAVNSVRRIIESELLRTNNFLWVQIRIRPELWADIAARLESPVMFNEAMVHVIGAYCLAEYRETMEIDDLAYGDYIKDLAISKIEGITDLKKEIDNELITFFPDRMKHGMVNGKCPGRARYATDIYWWQTIILIRDMMRTAMLEKATWESADGGASFYKKFAEGSNAYLSPNDLKPFHIPFPMTPKGKQCFERAMYSIKSDFKEIVAPLMVANIEGSTKGKANDVPWLLNAEIYDDDMPWIQAMDAQDYLEDSAEDDDLFSEY
jgi:hypothetical protein